MGLDWAGQPALEKVCTGGYAIWLWVTSADDMSQNCVTSPDDMSQPDMSPLHLSHYDAGNATDWRGAKMFQTGRSPLLSSTVFFIQSVSSNLARWFTCLVCLYDDLRGIVLRCQLHVDVQPGNSWSTTFQRWVGEQSLIFQVKAQNTKMCQKCINLTSSSNQSLNNNR